MPATAAVPKLQLPFAKGATWWVNGPHSFDGFTGARNSIDFGPGGSGAATVRAAAGGTAHVGTCSGGKYVTIDHGEGWSTRYWHLGSAARIDGKRVSAGDVIGKTALVCGNPTRFSHVHFGLFKKGAAVSLNGKSIGGYTVHSGASQYSGYWIRIKGGARVHTTGADGYAHCCLTNNQTQSTPSGDPIGNFDKATSPAAGKVRVAGWAFDPNRKRAPVRVVAYVGGASGASGAKRYSLGPAAKKRADVAKRHKGVGSNHGFDAIFSTSKRGKQKVCVYAINIGKGKSKLLGCKTVTIKSTASLGSAPLAQINAERGIAWGDFNRDGYADLAVGIPGEDVSSKRDAGSVNVIPGGSGGLNRAAATGYHQNHRGDANSIAVGSAEAGDYFGAAVTTGDFNRDGYADLAVGSPGEDIGSQQDAGTVHVILGGPGGLDRSKAYGYHQSDGSANSINVGSAEPGDYYGAALAAADFNRDDYADLAVGVPGEDVGSQKDAGTVNAIPGSAGGLDRNNAAGYHQNHRRDANSIPVGSAEAGDYFGAAVATGDFNRDGYADLAAGIPGEDIGSQKDAGAVNVIPGGPDDLDRSKAAGYHQSNDDANSISVGKAEAGDYLGAALAVGDFDRDNDTDLAVGAPGEDVGSQRDAGTVNLIPGSTGGLDRNNATGYHQNHRGDANSIPVGSAEPGDYFGAAVTTGDFNRDGYADLAVGSPGEDIGSQKEAGTAHVILGGSAGLDRSKAAGYHQSDGSANSINVGSAEPGDYYGAALAAADFNRDGYADLAVGIPGEDVSSQGDAGSVNAIPGSAGGLDRNNAAGYHQNHNGDANSIPVGNAEPGDYFGGGILGAAFQ